MSISSGTGSKFAKRGFASMDPAKRREICRLGGQAAHAMGKAHQWTSEEARVAGRLGGLKSKRGRAQQDSTAKSTAA